MLSEFLRAGKIELELTPQGTLSPMGMIPRTRRLRVAGTFNLGLYEIDSQTGFVALDIAKRLLQLSGTAGTKGR